MILSSLQAVELLRHVDATGEDSDPLIAALAAALRTCEPEAFEELEQKYAQLEQRCTQLEQDVVQSEEKGWRQGLERARELVWGEIELIAVDPTRNFEEDPTHIVLDRLEFEIEKVKGEGDEEHMIVAPPDVRNTLLARRDAVRACRESATRSRMAKAVAPLSVEPIEPQTAGSGKNQKLVVAYLRGKESVTRADLIVHLVDVGPTSKTGALNVLRRMIDSGRLLELPDGKRVALARIAAVD